MKVKSANEFKKELDLFTKNRSLGAAKHDPENIISGLEKSLNCRLCKLGSSIRIRIALSKLCLIHAFSFPLTVYQEYLFCMTLYGSSHSASDISCAGPSQVRLQMCDQTELKNGKSKGMQYTICKNFF